MLQNRHLFLDWPTTTKKHEETNKQLLSDIKKNTLQVSLGRLNYRESPEISKPSTEHVRVHLIEHLHVALAPS